MANKFYTKEKEINGKKYVAQFNGISAALEAVDGSYIEGSSNISSVKLAKYLFENVIVDPKGLTPDDFDSVEEFNEVTGWARDVMQGKFRDTENPSTTKKTSSK